MACSSNPSFRLKVIQQLLFPLGLLTIYSIFYMLYFSLPDLLLKQIYHDYLVTISADIINLLAPAENAIAVQNTLISTKTNLEVVRGCDGAGVMFLIIAAVLAFSTTIKRKLIGLSLGLLLVYLLNQIRIIGLYFIAAYRRDWFLPVHTYIAPSFIVLFCSLFFLWWAFYSYGRGQHQ